MRSYIADDGEVLEGVSDVLARFNFRKNEYIPKKVRERVYGEGTAIHKLVQMYLQGMGCPSAKSGTPVSNGYRSFLKYKDDHKLEPLLVEASTVSNVHRYGGTLDFYGLVDGEWELVDWKGIGDERTLKQLLARYTTQLAGYSALLEERRIEPIKRARIVMLDKTNPDNYVDRYVLEGQELTDRIGMFREMVATHRRMNELCPKLK